MISRIGLEHLPCSVCRTAFCYGVSERTRADTMETYFDSRLDLLQRHIQKHSDRLKTKAEEALKKRVHSSDALAENLDREIKNFRLKVISE